MLDQGKAYVKCLVSLLLCSCHLEQTVGKPPKWGRERQGSTGVLEVPVVRTHHCMTIYSGVWVLGVPVQHLAGECVVFHWMPWVTSTASVCAQG